MLRGSYDNCDVLGALKRTWETVAVDSIYCLPGTSLMAQMINNLPAMQETWARCLDGKDILEKGMGTHSSILAWRISRTEKHMAGYSSWGHKESDTTEQLTLSLHTSFLWLFFGYTQGCRGAYI